MEFTAYRRADGAWLLVPDCLVPSREAEARHGPLVLVARFDAECPAGDSAWQRVLDDIDAQAYALVRRETGEYLVRDAAHLRRA